MLFGRKIRELRDEQGVHVLYKDETVWATQKAMAQLFDCSTDNIGLHLKNIFKSEELVEDSVTEKNSATAAIRQFSLRGYIIDKKRMENGSFIGEVLGGWISSVFCTL